MADYAKRLDAAGVLAKMQIQQAMHVCKELYDQPVDGVVVREIAALIAINMASPNG